MFTRAIIACLLSIPLAAQYSVPARTLPGATGLKMTEPPVDGKVDRRLAKAAGQVEIVVRMVDPPLAAAVGHDAKKAGSRLTPSQQRAYVAQLDQKQNTLLAQIRGLGGKELGRVAKAHNAVIVVIDAGRLAQVAALPNVSLLRPVINYQNALSSTVPYIGAAAVHAAGLNGAGVRIAVLDSGIDYTHKNLGGPGTVAAYQAAYGLNAADPRNKTRDGLFPTAKVVDGFDFVGERWPSAPLAPDPDPIDFESHGTHVADIAAGKSNDGTHKGVAPEARLLAVKVCSTISTSCSGLASLFGIDFAIDPNGDGAIDDAVDVINLSLGSAYGQREDDLSEATALASRLGVIVVAAGGNEANRPFIAGQPSTTPEVISVAETQVPGAIAFPLVINAPTSIAGQYGNTATVDWAPIGAGFSGSVAYVGRGCPAGSVEGTPAADAYLANPVGKVALIDRGACSISLKIDRAAKAGAIGALLALSAAGDAVSFSFGGGTDFVSTLVITKSTGDLIKANIAAPVLVTVSPANQISLAGSTVTTSARGPGYSYNSIKPDLGAPGGSVSAVAGTGTAEAPFGGTSGASPMVAGAAALLVQSCPLCTPVEIKARLMNTAEINVFTNNAVAPGVLAPITRIGAGELRVNRAALITSSAWDAGDPASVSLSFGTIRSTGINTLKKKVLVRNYGSAARTYSIATSFRYGNDASSGAVTLNAPASITVPANGSSTFVLTMTVNSGLLPQWTLDGGPSGGDGTLLEAVEFDGYVTLTTAQETIRLPWHILPHKAANARAPAPAVNLNNGSGTLTLTNFGGAVAGEVDVFSLVGTSGKLPSDDLPRTGDNFAIIDLRAAGVRLVDFGGGLLALQFAINTWGERAHPNYPAEFDIFVDTNLDGVNDYVIFNAENGPFGSSGQNLIWVQKLTSTTANAFFFADADLNSTNMIMTVPLSALGITPATKIRFSVFAFDNYFTGLLTDAIPNIVYTPGLPRYFATGVPFTGVPVNGSSVLNITAVPGGAAASPSQTGLLLLYRDAKSGAEAEIIPVTP